MPAYATVEGTLVHATPSTFAGRRNNVSLGRSEASVAGLVPMQAFSPTTTGVLWKKEEGNVVSVRQAHALFVVTPKKRPPRSRTRPSLGPETRARQSSLSFSSAVQAVGEKCGAAVEISRSGKPAQAGGTGTGVTIVRTHARLAACHRFSGNREGRA